MGATRFLIVALAGLALAACGADEATRVETAPTAQAPLGVLSVVEELREGGYVLFLRHAITDHSERDELGFPLSDCSHQRNLTNEGREQARAIGRAFRELGIPVGTVLSSEYCRTRETAELAFGRVLIVDELTGLSEPGDPDRARRVHALRSLLARRPRRGSNTVIVGHIKNLEAATEISIEEGDTAIFEPRGEGRFRHVVSIPASVWPQVVAAEARR